MNLKEAFRYQNYLNGILGECLMAFNNRENRVKVVQEHLRKSAYSEAENETIEVPATSAYILNLDKLVEFVDRIIAEKQRVSAAIFEAKKACEFDLDGELSLNEYRRRAARVLADASCTKTTETTTKGQDYKFNAEGNQTPYTYNIKETTELKFDVDGTRKASKAFASKADEISTRADKFLIEAELDIEPMFSVNDSFADIVADFGLKE